MFAKKPFQDLSHLSKRSLRALNQMDTRTKGFWKRSIWCAKFKKCFYKLFLIYILKIHLEEVMKTVVIQMNLMNRVQVVFP